MHGDCPGVKGKGSRCACDCGHDSAGNKQAQARAAKVAITPAAFKKWMQDRGLSTTDVQRIFDVSRTTVTNWRRGIFPITRMHALALDGWDAGQGDDAA